MNYKLRQKLYEDVFDTVKNFSEDFAEVKLNGKSYQIDTNGKTIHYIAKRVEVGFNSPPSLFRAK